MRRPSVAPQRGGSRAGPALAADGRRHRARDRGRARGTTWLPAATCPPMTRRCRRRETTISANVPGRVIELDVHDNQAVRRGDVLFRLDDRAVPHRGRGGAGQAGLRTHADQRRRRPPTVTSWPNVAAARDTLAYQQQEFERQQRLLAVGHQLARAVRADAARAAAGAVAAHLGAAAGRQRAGDARRQSGIAAR